MTVPTPPYQPFQQPLSNVRGLYSSVVQVLRLTPTLEASGGMSLSWGAVNEVLDAVLDIPGYLACRLAIGYLRPGKDQLPPITAGRPQDRVGVVYYDVLTDSSGVPLVKAGDRFLCTSGPISGIWEMRNAPDELQGFSGADHAEAQVIEVTAGAAPGSVQPFGQS